MALLSCPLPPQPHVALRPAKASTNAAHRGRAQRRHSRHVMAAKPQFSCEALSLSLSLADTHGPRSTASERGPAHWRDSRRAPLPASGAGAGTSAVLRRGVRAHSAGGGARQGAEGSRAEEFPHTRFEQRGPQGATVQVAQGSSDARRLAVLFAILGLTTALQVALEGRLGGFVEGTLSFIVQLLFAITALDVSLTAATWLLGLFSQPSGLAECPWCTKRFKFDRQEAERHFLYTLANGAESGGAACPSCGGQLVFTGLDAEPFFTRRPGAEAPLGVAFRKGKWDPEGNGKIVDVEATVYNKD